jgi:DNA-binding transcriptional ArsR family regulator
LSLIETSCVRDMGVSGSASPSLPPAGRRPAVDALDVTQPGVSHHLALLRHAGIVTPRRNGKQNMYCQTETCETLAEVVNAVVV